MPARKIPKYGAQKNMGKFFSVKTGLVAWYEALTERDYMYLLDFDPTVVAWWEQPLQMRYSHDGKTHRYTPDLEVHRTSKKQIVEVKPKDKVESGEWDFLFRTAASICEPEGYEFIVVTDEQIRVQPKLNNVKKLWKYARTPVGSHEQVLCAGYFQQRHGTEITLGDLKRFFKAESVPVQTLYALLFWGALDFDLMQPLDSGSLIRLSSATASATVNRKAS